MFEKYLSLALEKLTCSSEKSPILMLRFQFEMLFSTQLTYLVVAKISQIKFVAQTLINSDILFYNSKRKAYFSKEKHISQKKSIFLSDVISYQIWWNRLYQFSALIEFWWWWWWWWIYFEVMVDRRKASSLICSRNHCHRSTPLRISDNPRAGFEPVQNLSPGVVKWSCAVVITTAPPRHV